MQVEWQSKWSVHAENFSEVGKASPAVEWKKSCSLSLHSHISHLCFTFASPLLRLCFTVWSWSYALQHQLEPIQPVRTLRCSCQSLAPHAFNIVEWCQPDGSVRVFHLHTIPWTRNGHHSCQPQKAHHRLRASLIP